MKPGVIYTIMVMEKLESTGKGYPYYGASRVVGFYNKREHARECVMGNYGDIWETCYNYAVIEKIEEGLYSDLNDREFFKFDLETRTYKPYPEPDFMNNYVGLTMG